MIATLFVFKLHAQTYTEGKIDRRFLPKTRAMSAHRPEQLSPEQISARPESALPTQIAIGAAGIAVFLAIGVFLWMRHGEAIYVDRLFSMIANCF